MQFDYLMRTYNAQAGILSTKLEIQEQRPAIFSILHLQAFLFLQGLIQTKLTVLTGIDERMKGAHDCIETE